MDVYLIFILLLNFFGFSLQSNQCHQKFVEEADGRYNFVVDCSNLGLEKFPEDLSDLTTTLYLNGNRLKDIDKKALNKLTLLEVLDLSANDITSLAHGIFDNNKKLKTLDLGRNRLHCDWRVWWLVNFTKTLESFNGYCFSPTSLRGRDVRRLTEKDVIVDCASKRKLNNQSKDGHYVFDVAGPSGGNIRLLIYCHDMESTSPKEYLSLPGGKQRNYISVSSGTINGCLRNNASSQETSKFIGYEKVRLILRTLTIVPNDLTFATASVQANFGSGRICGLANGTTCIGADAKIDLRGTPFKVKNSVSWHWSGSGTEVDVVRKFDGAVTEIKCSSACNGCSLASTLLLEPIDTRKRPFEACSRTLGIQDGRIPSSNITASTYLDRNFLPSYARLFHSDRGGWCAAKPNRKQFIQVDLGVMHTISGVSTQGYKTYSDWVTSYKIVYKADDDVWKEYTLFGNPKVFQGNSDSNTVVTHWLDPRIRARSIRINPQSWYDGDLLDHRICLRFELYGCKNDVSSYIVKLGSSKPCILPATDVENITDGVKLMYSSKCSGTNFMFRLDGENALVHTLSGYCLGANENSTAVLTKNCKSNKFIYQRIVRGGSHNSNLIIKHKDSGKCVRLKRSKNKDGITVVLRKCGDISQILLVLTKTGVTPLKPYFKEPKEIRDVDMFTSQTFHCSFVSDPPSISAWSKGIPLRNGGTKLLDENVKTHSNGSLHISNVTWNDRGIYFCNVLNSEGSETRLVELTVHAIQRFIKKPKAQETVVSKTVTFDCIVEGIPKPRILWKFKPHNSDNFARIDSLDQKRFKLSPNGTLTIKNVHFSDKGLYVCVAKSPGKKTDAAAFLMVYVPPRITLSSKRKSIYVGDSARVTCHATGEPYPLVAWYKLPDLNSSNPRNRGRVDGNISIDRVNKDDGGTYICSAKNIVGKATASFRLIVTATCNFIHIRYSDVIPNRSFFIENEEVKVRCQKGFRMIGAPRLLCTRYGNWSHSFPRCVDINECQKPFADIQEGSGQVANLDTEPDVCHVNAVCSNTIGSFRCACEEGYEGNGFTCNWRSTTTKAPTTIPTTTTTPKPTTTDAPTKEISLATKGTSEERTTTEIPLTTTLAPYSPAIWSVYLNFTQGLVPELVLLRNLLQHSLTIRQLPNMERKLQGLSISLAALKSVSVSKRPSRHHPSHGTPKRNVEMFTNVVSSLLDSANSDVWKKKQESTNAASELLSIVDKYTRKRLKDWASKSDDVEIVAENIAVRIKDLSNLVGTNDAEISLFSNSRNTPDSRVVFNKSTFEDGKQTFAILIQYKNLEKIFSSGSADDANRTHFVSKIVSLTVASIKDGEKLKKPVLLEFKREQIKSQSPECVFWKFNSSKNGGYWSDVGCKLYKGKSMKKSKSTITCECNHLTNFAVIDRRPISGPHKGSGFFVLTLSLSVMIGCGISIFFAFLTCISHLCCSTHVRSDRRIIMINICACILLGSTIFLGGALLSSFKLIKDDISKYFCLVMSGSLQLFFIAFFSWMLAEAIQIFLSTRTVIDKGSGKLTMFYLLGWGFPTVVVGVSMVLILFDKVQITSWCWIDLSSYTHFLLTGIPAFILFVITIIFYVLISVSLRKNHDLINPFIQRYTKFALWCSPILLILHVMAILALAAYLSFNNNYIYHYILGGLYGVEGLFLIVYQCYIEKLILSRSGAMSPAKGKRQHSYSVKDTVTYKDEACCEEANGKYLIRRPSKRSLADSIHNSVSVSVGVKGSRRSDLDQDSDSNYFDMYGTSERLVSSRSANRVPVVAEDDVDEEDKLLHEEDDDRTVDSNETSSEPQETQLTSFEVNNTDSILKKKPSSHCGSVVSVETKPRQPIQGIPVYFPGSAPPQHMLTLERKKKSSLSERDSEERYDNIDDIMADDDMTTTNSKESVDPDQISNISNELTSILKELEAFSSDGATPKVPRKCGKPASTNGDANSSPVWQRRKESYGRQGKVEMKDVHYGTGPTHKTNWYGHMKDSGDGLYKCTDDLQTSF